MQGLTIHLFKSSYDAFTDLLKANNVEHRRRLPLAGVVMANGSTVEIIQAVGVAAGAILVPVAAVVTQYLKGKQTREVKITLRDGQSVDAKGLEPEELERVLSLAEDIMAFDPAHQTQVVAPTSSSVADDDPGPG